jgi:hypothetical protein
LLSCNNREGERMDASLDPRPKFQGTSPSAGIPGEVNGIGDCPLAGRGGGDCRFRSPISSGHHPHPNPLPDYRERGPNRNIGVRFLGRLLPAGILLLPLLIAAATTAPTTAPAAPPTTAPAPLATFDKDGVKFCYPANWPGAPAKTAEFDVVAPPAVCHGSATLSLDVPSLPPFVPFFISAERVEGGYVKNLRKAQIPNAKIDQDASVTVCGCQGRCVKCSGLVKGTPQVDVAVILVHARRVYILSCDSDAAGYAQARAALDLAVQSLTWTK